jgi:hypothetical protein
VTRILITGSRDWTDIDKITEVLRGTWIAAGMPDDITLVSGSCRTGADAIAEEVWERQGFPIESHPADWSVGKQAGFIRNAEMVSLGADICLAFIKNESKGATMTADLAQKSGIPTFRFTETSND